MTRPDETLYVVAAIDGFHLRPMVTWILGVIATGVLVLLAVVATHPAAPQTAPTACTFCVTHTMPTTVAPQWPLEGEH